MKKIKLIGLIIGVSSGILLPIILNITSCSKKREKDLTNYIGNDTGTNWKGYETGTVILTFDMVEKTCVLTDSDLYKATDLVIPNQIKRGNRIFNLKEINASFGSITQGNLLTGSLYLPGNMRFRDAAFNICGQLNNTLSFAGDADFINGSCFFGNSFTSIVLPGDYSFEWRVGDSSHMFSGGQGNKINLGIRNSSPCWYSNETGFYKNLVFEDYGRTGDIEVSGTWNNKQEVLEYMEQWGIPSTGWTVNGQ